MKKFYEQPMIDVAKYAMTEDITETNKAPNVTDIDSEEWGVEEWE